MSVEKFKTIKREERAEINEKKSKFIANIFYVENVEEAEKIIKDTKKKYNDARHNCYAYIINSENLIKKYSDDGEPNGTAGSPILNVIEKNNLNNVLIIVTRYFGGILLGTGGLTRAYAEASTKVVEKSEIIEKELGYEVEVEILYQDIEKFKYYCSKNNINITNIDYKENIICKIEVTKKQKNQIFDTKYDNKIINLLKYNIIKEKYIEKNKN